MDVRIADPLTAWSSSSDPARWHGRRRGRGGRGYNSTCNFYNSTCIGSTRWKLLLSALLHSPCSCQMSTCVSKCRHVVSIPRHVIHTISKSIIGKWTLHLGSLTGEIRADTVEYNEHWVICWAYRANANASNNTMKAHDPCQTEVPATQDVLSGREGLIAESSWCCSAHVKHYVLLYLAGLAGGELRSSKKPV